MERKNGESQKNPGGSFVKRREQAKRRQRKESPKRRRTKEQRKKRAFGQRWNGNKKESNGSSNIVTTFLPCCHPRDPRSRNHRRSCRHHLAESTIITGEVSSSKRCKPSSLFEFQFSILAQTLENLKACLPCTCSV